MRNVALWMAGGCGLAVTCGQVGLSHLSATLVTLTLFCAVPQLLVLALGAISAGNGPSE